MTHSVVLIGCGNMGFAMLTGWVSKDPTLTVHAVEPADQLRMRAADAGAKAVSNVDELPADLKPDLIVLAIKPQLIVSVLECCGALAKSGATFVSVAAGVSISRMMEVLPPGTPIIRSMPNTPVAVGEGMMALCAGENVSDDVRNLTESLFSASGAVAWIDDEELMDAVTAISGSGPAYVFHFIEALTSAGTALGLPEDVAALMATQTVAGAGKMALTLETSAGVLRQQVTSPGGTTAAALKVFMDENRLSDLVLQATTAARDRGVELGKNR